VQMETMWQGLKTGFLASAGRLFWNRFTGPGRVGIQSMYMPNIGGTAAAQDNPGGAGDVIGGIFRGITGR
jgi:uncharacterized protein (AIM24 family)